jgi:hypothetical protein
MKEKTALYWCPRCGQYTIILGVTEAHCGNIDGCEFRINRKLWERNAAIIMSNENVMSEVRQMCKEGSNRP